MYCTLSMHEDYYIICYIFYKVLTNDKFELYIYDELIFHEALLPDDVVFKTILVMGAREKMHQSMESDMTLQ